MEDTQPPWPLTTPELPETDAPFNASAIPVGEDALWVFAYGSLIWNPGFPYEEQRKGTLHGYHRRFCVASHRYRGTPDRPGLVLGLDRGGSCHGLVFRVAPRDVDDVLRYLWDREMVTRAYRPRLLRCRTDDGFVQATTFTVDHSHPQYCGREMPIDQIARIIAFGQGNRGRNLDYLINTVDHLDAMGVVDHYLHGLVRRVRGMEQSLDASSL